MGSSAASSTVQMRVSCGSSIPGRVSVVTGQPSHANGVWSNFLFDGERFRNLEPTPRGGIGVALPFCARRVWTTLAGRDGAPPSVPNDGVREDADGLERAVAT